jgi:hypothetical protein
MSPYDEAVKRFKTFYWEELLRQTGGNVKQAAVLAGKNRTQVHKLLGKCGIHRKRRRGKSWFGLLEPISSNACFGDASAPVGHIEHATRQPLGVNLNAAT